PVEANSSLVVADFTADPVTTTCPPLLVNFYETGKGSTDSIVAWDWDFGDGSRSSLRHPKKNYLVPGTYSVSLTVSDRNGCTNTKKIPDLVIVGGPTGTYQFTPSEGCIPV